MTLRALDANAMFNVAGVHVGGVGGLVLALEDARDPCREAAERLVRRVHDVPASPNLEKLRVPFSCSGGSPGVARGHR
jgi:hypothetical protein